VAGERQGITDLFAALDVTIGEVLYDRRKSRTTADVLSFFKYIDLHVEPGMEVHVVLDNRRPHGPEVTRLASPKRKRGHLHLTRPARRGWTPPSAG
jgi:hypothetical protein